MYIDPQELGRDLVIGLLITLVYFVVNRRRSVLLPRYAAERGFVFEKTLDASSLNMAGVVPIHGDSLRNIITGTLDGTKFLYCEKDRSSEGDRESLLVFELTSSLFAPPKPPMFGFLSSRTTSHVLFWWDQYLVPLKEMDAFLGQGVQAFKVATHDRSQSQPVS